jgi:hypothetical protein
MIHYRLVLRFTMHVHCPTSVPHEKKASKSLDFEAFIMAGWTRLELATSGLTGRRSNQLNYQPRMVNSDSINGRCRIRTYDHLLVRQVLCTS